MEHRRTNLAELLLNVNYRSSLGIFLFSGAFLLAGIINPTILSARDNEEGTFAESSENADHIVIDRLKSRHRLIKGAQWTLFPAIILTGIAYEGYTVENDHIRSTGNYFDTMSIFFTAFEIQKARLYPTAPNIGNPLYFISYGSFLRSYRHEMLKEHRIHRSSYLEVFATPALVLYGLSGFFYYLSGGELGHNGEGEVGSGFRIGENASADLVFIPGGMNDRMIGISMRYTIP